MEVNKQERNPIRIPLELIQARINGDFQALEELLRDRNFITICEKGFYSAGLKQESWEDAMQEVRIICFAKIHLLNPKQNVCGWLFTVARSQAINLLRKKRNWLHFEPKQVDIPDHRPHAHSERQALARNELNLIQRALGVERARILFLMHEGHTQEQIASILGVKRREVRTRLARIKVSLPSILERLRSD